MDLTKCMYNNVGPNILERLYDEKAKIIIADGALEDYLKLPLTYTDDEKSNKCEKEIKCIEQKLIFNIKK